jgi:hypothetical protein
MLTTQLICTTFRIGSKYALGATAVTPQSLRSDKEGIGLSNEEKEDGP